MSDRSAVVTGATGFVGRHLVKHLLGAGWRVQAIVRPTSDCSPLAGLGDRFSLVTHEGGIDSLIEYFQASRPSVVFHLASLVLSEHQPKDVEPLIQSNLLFGTQLVEAMTQAGVTSLVNTGTAWQHYEGHDYKPVNLYAASKQAYQALLHYYIEACGLQVITLKLGDTYGPEDYRKKIVGLLLDAASKNILVALSVGEQEIDLVHVEDVVGAFLAAAERLHKRIGSSNHEMFSVTSGEPISIRHLVGMLEKIIGSSIPVKWGARHYRDREVFDPWMGDTIPGWSPEVSLEDGLSRLSGKGADEG
jgi:nucleoside-diphosphate-sugar epimerase